MRYKEGECVWTGGPGKKGGGGIEGGGFGKVLRRKK